MIKKILIAFLTLQLFATPSTFTKQEQKQIQKAKKKQATKSDKPMRICPQCGRLSTKCPHDTYRIANNNIQPCGREGCGKQYTGYC